MKRLDPQNRSLLAAEYVLGTLRGKARRRFEHMRASDAACGKEVDRWERHLNLLADGLPAVEPSARLWEEVRRRTARRPTSVGLWNHLALWRGLAFAAGSVALALLVLMVWSWPMERMSAPTHVAVLGTDQGRPAWLVRAYWIDRRFTAEPLLAPSRPDDKSYELWLLPDPEQAPIPLGLVENARSQSLELSRTEPIVLGEAPALAVTLEPQGGSPIGLPTGPVVVQGPLIESGR